MDIFPLPYQAEKIYATSPVGQASRKALSLYPASALISKLGLCYLLVSMEDKTLILLTSKLLLPLMSNENCSQAHNFADSPLWTWWPFDLLYRSYGFMKLYGSVRISRINSAQFFMLVLNTIVRTIISSAAAAYFPGETCKV